MSNEIKCPRCGSDQVSANKKGWSLTTGAIGMNKIRITCLKCGKQFKPREDLDSVKKNKELQKEAMKSPLFWIILVVIFIILLRACS